jgi:hypothetical protein
LSFTQKDFSVFVPEKDTTKLLLKYWYFSKIFNYW